MMSTMPQPVWNLETVNVFSGLRKEMTGRLVSLVMPRFSLVSSLVSTQELLLSEPEGVPQFQKGNDPFTLTFFKQREDKLWRYDICPVRPGTEARINAALENIPAKYRKILFLPDSMEQQAEIHVACEHCFVLHDKDGYHFYQ